MEKTLQIELRPEQEGDYRETEFLVREAFWNHYSPACNEHYLLHVMRECPDFVKGLDYVAVCDGRIVGNVVYMKSHIMTDQGERQEVLSLGPIAVLPGYQGKGIGRMLIERTRELAREMGSRAIFLCGDPDYYTRTGFVPAEQFGIRTSEDNYFIALHAFELYEGALATSSGRYYESPAYYVDERAATEFDKAVPPKPIFQDTPTQRRFLEIAAMQRKRIVEEKP